MDRETENVGLEDIVVTATKRSENLQDCSSRSLCDFVRSIASKGRF